MLNSKIKSLNLEMRSGALTPMLVTVTCSYDIFVVHDSTKEVTTNSNQKQSVEKETARLNATVRVSSGERSTYYPAYRQKSSQEFQTYASAFISEVS